MSLFVVILTHFVALWVRKQEKRILNDGELLSAIGADLIKAATYVGVLHPEKIRVIVVKHISLPPFSRLIKFLIHSSLPLEPKGIAYGYGILITCKCKTFAEKRALIAHEMVHVAQCEKEGGIIPFVHAYVRECAENGYFKNKFEVEAYSKGDEFRVEED